MAHINREMTDDVEETKTTMNGPKSLNIPLIKPEHSKE